MVNTHPRRLTGPLARAALACVALAGAGLALATSPAAAALTPLTICSQPIGTIEYTAGYVAAEAFRVCEDGTEPELTVSIQRQNPSTGSWTTVATGHGHTSYKCQGTASRRYRVVPGGASFVYPCT